MSDYRFYPLAELPHDGILTVHGEPFPAAFWTLKEAKAAAQVARPALKKSA